MPAQSLAGPITTTKIDIATSGDNNVIAAVASQKVYLVSAFLVSAGTVTLVIDDGTSALTGAMSMVVGVPFLIPEQADGSPYLSTTAGNALSLKLGGNVQVSGWIKTMQV